MCIGATDVEVTTVGTRFLLPKLNATKIDDRLTLLNVKLKQWCYFRSMRCISDIPDCGKCGYCRSGRALSYDCRLLDIIIETSSCGPSAWMFRQNLAVSCRFCGTQACILERRQCRPIGLRVSVQLRNGRDDYICKTHAGIQAENIWCTFRRYEKRAVEILFRRRLRLCLGALV